MDIFEFKPGLDFFNSPLFLLIVAMIVAVYVAYFILKKKKLIGKNKSKKIKRKKKKEEPEEDMQVVEVEETKDVDSKKIAREIIQSLPHYKTYDEMEDKIEALIDKKVKEYFDEHVEVETVYEPLDTEGKASVAQVPDSYKEDKEVEKELEPTDEEVQETEKQQLDEIAGKTKEEEKLESIEDYIKRVEGKVDQMLEHRPVEQKIDSELKKNQKKIKKAC